MRDGLYESPRQVFHNLPDWSRYRALGVGLVSGGYGQDELQLAAANRVYEDPADLLRHLDEVGVRGAE
jgi:hypothetical protein